MSFCIKVCWKLEQGNATYNPPYRTDQNPHASQMAHLEFMIMIKYWPAAGSGLWQLTQLRTNLNWMYEFQVQFWSVNMLVFLYLPYQGKFMKHSSVTTWVIKDLQKCRGYTFFFNIHGSMHRDPILIRSNEMQQYAGVDLMQNYSTCFGCLSHPSSGVHQTVTAASGTGHITCQRNNLLPVWPIGHAGGRLLLWHYDLYQKLHLQFDVLLMMGAIDTRKM